MTQNTHVITCSRNWVAFILLFGLIFLCYSNTFHASWHLDDKHNIQDNSRIHLKDFSTQSIIKIFYSSSSLGDSKLYRPVACLTLALNWYFGQTDVFGYHVVNFSIHILAALFLYLTILNLYKSPRLESVSGDVAYFTALLTAVLWAINPIQTQAVTYIVQRMASLAAMFYIAGMYLYIKGRNAELNSRRIIYYAGCLVIFILAIGSKENAATLPVALLLVEILFYQNLTLPSTKKRMFWIAVFTGVAFIAFCLIIFFWMRGSGNPIDFLKSGYSKRAFTLEERLMTEPRIIVFYLSQIFYPIASRLSLDHDITISHSLLEPWTTLPSILFVVFMIGFGIIKIKKQPIVAFAILFFFLNHLIESTIFSLELVFEHRNYLPSFFLFFPVSVGLKKMIDYYKNEKKSMYIILGSFVTLILIGLGTGTLARNMVWRTEKTLWEDTKEKAPGRARGYQNLAASYFSKTGEIDKAIELNQQALNLRDSKPRYAKHLSLNNIGGLYLQKKEYNKAINYLTKAVAINPTNQAMINLTISFIQSGRLDEAMKNLEHLLSKKKKSEKSIYLKGVILLKKGEIEDAVSCFREALKIKPYYRPAKIHLGVSLSLMGKYNIAEMHLIQADKAVHGRNIRILFALIENSAKAGIFKNAEHYTEKLTSNFSYNDIISVLNKIEVDELSVPVSREIITREIVKKMRSQIEKMDAS